MIATGWVKVTTRKERVRLRKLLSQVSFDDMPKKREYELMPQLPEDGDYRFRIVGVVRETENAALVHFGDRHDWLPLSVIKLGRASDGKLVVDMPEWLARKNKLI